MVYKKSVYQNEFKLSIAKEHQATYLENLTFRHSRRDREFLHTPICWGELNEEEAQLSENEETCPSKSKSKTSKSDEPQYQSLAEILAESSKKNEAFRQKKGMSVDEPIKEKLPLSSAENKDSSPENKTETSLNVNESVEEVKSFKDKRLDTYILPKEKLFEDDTDIECDTENENKLKEGCKYVLSDSKLSKSSKQSTLCAKSRGSVHKAVKSRPTGRPKRPDRQGVIPGSKRRPQSAVNSSIDKPPFISYGVGDKEPTLAIHRTHNVRSSVDVYSQALKAQRIREAQKRKRQKEKQRAVQSANALLEKLAIVTPRDNQSWQSEYRKQFHGYQPQEYEKAISARAVIPRSTPINAVHRGNCLIVHVD